MAVPKWLLRARRPRSVSRTVRPRRRRSAQPFLKKVSAIAEPSAPEMCGRRSLLFTNIYLTVGEEKILRASQVAKIPSGEGQFFGKARLDRGAEVAGKGATS